MKEYSSLFEQQSYIDAAEYYNQTLSGSKQVAYWDYIILTASNEAQAKAYEMQLDYRKSINALPSQTHFAVLPDPDGKRVGSGGATLNVIRYVFNHSGDFKGKKILVIHSGGDSKRVPQYSACGKLFSPVPRQLTDGRRSTLFDEFMIGMSTVASRMNDGMLVCSGDVLLLFNALQIDFYTKGAAALSIKEDVETGKNHGVFLKGDSGNVGQFLHKQTVETLSKLGAVDDKNKVDIDIGAVIFDSDLVATLYSLIDTDEGFNSFVNEKARLSFYADFLYPLAEESTLEQFYKEKPEGDFTEELKSCRTKIWELIHGTKMKLIQLSPASFIHFGTTRELLKLMTDEMDDYKFLGWSGQVNTNSCDKSYAASNSFISRGASVGAGSYIEDCYIYPDTKIGENCVLSGVTLKGQSIPENIVLHGLKLNDGRFVVRMYGIEDNPKESKLFGKDFREPLWDAKIYPVCDTIEDAVNATLDKFLKNKSFNGTCMSLNSSFNMADTTQILPWQSKLEDKIKAESILQAIDDGVFVENVAEQYKGISSRVIKHLTNEAERMDEMDLVQFGRKLRIYFYLAKILDDSNALDRCFGTIGNAILKTAVDGIRYRDDYKICTDEVVVRLPIRINWGGGWSDTPPYCIEHGGTVLNAAISFDGLLPIEITLKRLDENKIILASTDIGSYQEFTDIAELQDCSNPSEAFALHKAALISCGVIPLESSEVTLEDITSRLGGGIYLNTRVINIPKGSGLGTSSILAGACVKGLYKFFNVNISDNDLYNSVLCMEQLMSTGGGWQDQVGGLAPGIKMVSSQPGLNQKIECVPLKISTDTLDELGERLCLIYTGQRRLARNLLREVVGRYIGNNPDSLEVLYEIQRVAVLMKFELEKGNIDGFAQLLNKHWALSQRLDKGCTNTCIDQIFLAVEDLIDGRMICGAGGGGFLQVVLKKGVKKEALKERLRGVFQDSGVDVYSCKIEF